MTKFKLFIENFLVYGLGGIISKIIPLIMIPIVTYIIPNTEEYGVSDMTGTVVQLGIALALMGMYDAMYRMFFEKDNEDYKKDVCSTAFIFTLAASMLTFLLVLFFRNQVASFFLSKKDYAYVVYIAAISTLVGATNSIIAAPTRMQNKKKIFLITNAISPILSYLISIPLLIKGHYVIALPLAGLIASIFLEIVFGILNHKWFSFRRFDINLLKQLLVIAIPLLPNFLIYWVFNSCDKVMITNLIGIGESGIYSVGSKLGHVSQLIYTAFAGGWQYFAFSTMKEKDQIKTNSVILEYLGIISFVTSSFVCAGSYFFYKLLFDERYISGYIIAPYLFLAPLLQMLFQVAANQFLVVKKTWPNLFILSSGACINLFLNMILIPRIGIEGAAIATLIGYVVSDFICIIVLVKMKLMVVSNRFMLAMLAMALFMVIWRLYFSERTLISICLAALFSVIILLPYKKDICGLTIQLKNSKVI